MGRKVCAVAFGNSNIEEVFANHFLSGFYFADNQPFLRLNDQWCSISQIKYFFCATNANRLLSTYLTRMTDHRQLIKDCLKGNPVAQKQLYSLFAEPMLGICYRYTKSITDAEDVMQEGFIKVFLHLHQYKSEGELGGWIRRIMVTTAINYLKKNSQYKYDLVFENSNVHLVTDDDPEMQMSTKELAEMIRQLPTGYQTIFNLHAVEGYSHVEIGKMLGINEGTSRSQYARARGLLISWINRNKEDVKKQLYAQ